MYTSIIVLILAIVGFGIYANTLHNPFIWDDNSLVVNNPDIKSFKNIKEIFSNDLYHNSPQPSRFYRPLQSLSYTLEYSIWRLNPSGYHLSNIILHILNAILAFFLIHILFGQRVLSFLTSILFLIHPINSQVVNYISSRADLLVALFIFISLLLFIKYCGEAKIVYFIGAIVSFALALLSKEFALIMPLIVIFVGSVLRLQKKFKEGCKLGIAYISFFILAGVYIWLRLAVLDFGLDKPLLYSPESIGVRLLTFVKATGVLLRLVFLPFGLHMGRNIELAHSIFEVGVLLPLLLLVVLAGVGMWAVRRAPEVSFGVGWFFLMLLPVSNIIPGNARIAEHWMYLPSIGFFLFVTGGISRIVHDARGTRQYEKVALAPVFMILLFYSTLTVLRNRDWQDPEVFYKKALQYSNLYVIHNNLGIIYGKRGEYDKAIEQFKAGLATNPDMANLHMNLSIAYKKKGMLKESAREYNEAIRLNPRLRR